MTQRQVRIANLVKGDHLDIMNSSAMLNQESSLTLRNKFGQSDGIRSTKAFLTSVTPNAGMEKKQSLAFGSDI